MTPSLRINLLKIDKFEYFSCDIDYTNTNSRKDVFRDVISLIITNVTPGAQRALPTDTKCPLPAQRKQVKANTQTSVLLVRMYELFISSYISS